MRPSVVSLARARASPRPPPPRPRPPASTRRRRRRPRSPPPISPLASTSSRMTRWPAAKPAPTATSARPPISPPRRSASDSSPRATAGRISNTSRSSGVPSHLRSPSRPTRTTISSPTDWVPFGGRGTPRSLDGVRVIYGGVFTDSTTWITAAQADGPSRPLHDAARLARTARDRSLPPRQQPLHRRRRRRARRPRAPHPRRTPRRIAPPGHVSHERRHRALRAHTPDDDRLEHHRRDPPRQAARRRQARRRRRHDPRRASASSRHRSRRGTSSRSSRAATRSAAANIVALGAHSDHIGIRDGAVDHDSLRAYNGAVWDLRGRDPLGAAPSPAALAAIHINVDSLHRSSPARLDSINNGADDDGSGSVGLLEIAEAAAALQPHPKRSLLFVWHTGEELGLLGSRWYADHPTVPRDSIVAQFNIDMIGRGGAERHQGRRPELSAGARLLPPLDRARADR